MSYRMKNAALHELLELLVLGPFLLAENTESQAHSAATLPYPTTEHVTALQINHRNQNHNCCPTAALTVFLHQERTGARVVLRTQAM